MDYFRALGFFSSWQGKETAGVCESIMETRQGQGFDLHSPVVDLDLLLHAGDAVWTGDMEDCGDTEGYYAEALAAWAAVSRGALAPFEIVEDFGQPLNKPTLVWFRQGDKRYVVLADHTDESQWGVWLDLTVLDQLSIIIAESDREFVLFKDPSQEATVLCLTPDEQESLKRERGWRFHFDDSDDETEDEFLARFGVIENTQLSETD